jgi:malate synthase
MARDLHMNYLRIGSLSVAKALHEFIQQAAAPGTSISAEAFWSGFAELLRECGTRNRQLLQVRDELQSRIDQYHRERSGEPLGFCVTSAMFCQKAMILLSAPLMSMTRSR